VDDPFAGDDRQHRSWRDLPPTPPLVWPTAAPLATPIVEPAGSSFLRPRLVHGKIPTIEVRAIQGLYGFLRFVGIRHFDETETA